MHCPLLPVGMDSRKLELLNSTSSNMNLGGPRARVRVLDVRQVESAILIVVDQTPHSVRLLSKRARALEDPRLITRRLGSNRNLDSASCRPAILDSAPRHPGILDEHEIRGARPRVRSQGPETVVVVLVVVVVVEPERRRRL